MSDIELAAPAPLISVEQHDRLDRLEAELLRAAPAVEAPLRHTFTPGIYRREIFMPAGTLVTSKIHKIEHSYAVLSGKVSVYIPGTPPSVEHIEGPFLGITKAGTRRVLYNHTDVWWVTFHPNPEDEEDLAKLEEVLIERRELGDGSTIYDAYVEKLLHQAAAGALENGNSDEVTP